MPITGEDPPTPLIGASWCCVFSGSPKRSTKRLLRQLTVAPESKSVLIIAPPILTSNDALCVCSACTWGAGLVKFNTTCALGSSVGPDKTLDLFSVLPSVNQGVNALFLRKCNGITTLSW